jgi:hypothetical protein
MIQHLESLRQPEQKQKIVFHPKENNWQQEREQE